MVLFFLKLDRMSAIFETIIVIFEVLGTILLARKKIIGWYLYIVMISIVGILVVFINPNSAIILGILEIASIYFYIKGIMYFSKKSILVILFSNS